MLNIYNESKTKETNLKTDSQTVSYDRLYGVWKLPHMASHKHLVTTHFLSNFSCHSRPIIAYYKTDK